jgi:hypothetical protein
VLVALGRHRERELRRGGRRDVLERGALGLQQPPRGLGILRPQRLELGELHGHAGAPVHGIGRQQGEHVAERIAGLDSAPRGAQGVGLCEQQLEPPRVVLVTARQQPQRRRVPARGGRRRRQHRLLGGARQQLDRVEIAEMSRPLDVVRALRRRRAALRQRLGRARVGGKPPAAAAGLVHRTADERMAEPEAPRVLREPHQVGDQERIHSRQRDRFLHTRHRSRDRRVERVAGHRAGLRDQPRLLVEPGDLIGQRRHDRARHPGGAGRR